MPVPRTAGGHRGLALLLVLTGAAGLLASWVVTLDTFKPLENPNFTPGCSSLNPVVSCGSVLAGAAFPRWYWLTFDAGCLSGIGFVSWLQFESA